MVKLKKIVYSLADVHLRIEEATFGRQHRKREGHMFYRQGRLVTGSIPKKFGCELTGGDRAKGCRIVWIIDNDYTDQADELFNIGPDKKITEDTYESWPTYLIEFFDSELRGAAREASKRKEEVRTQHIERFTERFDEIINMTTIQDVENARDIANEEMAELHDNGIWSDRRNKLYKYVYETYMPALDERINELEHVESEDEEEHDESGGEQEHDELGDELEHVESEDEEEHVESDDEEEHDESEGEQEHDESHDESESNEEVSDTQIADTEEMVREIKEILTENSFVRDQIIRFLQTENHIE